MNPIIPIVLEDHDISGNTKSRNLTLKEIWNQDILLIIGDGFVIPHDIIVEQQPVITEPLPDENVVTQPANTHFVGNKTVHEELRRSFRQRRLAIPNDYIVYLQEADNGIGIEDPLMFNIAIDSANSEKW